MHTKDFFSFQFCCDILSLDLLDRFLLPTENFAFGVITSSSVGLLTYLNQFLADHFRYTQADFSTPVIGDSIALTESNRESDRALRLLQFFISKHVANIISNKV